jgi:hypothetical protein
MNKISRLYNNYYKIINELDDDRLDQLDWFILRSNNVCDRCSVSLCHHLILTQEAYRLNIPFKRISSWRI